MQITLYTNKSDKRTLNKTLVELSAVEIILKNDTDITRPVISLNSDFLPPGANYCYIPEFARYYYLTEQRVLIGRMLEITLAIDVLMSWRAQILESTAIAVRSTNKPHRGLPDEIPLLSKRNIIYKRLRGGVYDSDLFGSDKIGAERYSILLTVINGDVNITLDIISLEIGVTLKWSDYAGATSYQVERMPDGGEWGVIVSTSSKIYTDSPPEGVWHYRVRAVLENGEYSSYSNIATANVGGSA